MALSTSLLKPVLTSAAVLTAALLLLGHAAHAQQASFNVMVTLRYAPQPMAAFHFCPDGRPQPAIAKSFAQVQCPADLHNKTTVNQNTGTVGLHNTSKPAEVLVTF